MSEVLYADVKFKNPKGISAQADASTSNDSTYSEVRFSRAQGNDPSQNPTDNSASQPVGSKGASGSCDAVKVGLGLLCALLLAAVIALTVLYIQNKDLQKNLTYMQTKDKQTKEDLRQNLTDMQTKDKQTIEALQKNLTDYSDVQLQTKEKLRMMMSENNVLKKNLTDMETKDIQNKDLQKTLTDMQTKDKETIEAQQQSLTDSNTKLTSCQAEKFSCPPCIQLPNGATCPKPCATGWESYGGKCYWFSSYKYTWDQSRNDCIKNKHADLVQIDSRDEQKFLQGKLKEIMAEAEDKFWIGLTDSKNEGQWVWADGSPLTERFWSGKEPDNWGGNKENGPYPDGEDCVRMGDQVASELTWFDAFCGKPHKYICEKQAGTGRVESTCV